MESAEAGDGSDDEEVGAEDDGHQQRRQHQQSRVRHLPVHPLVQSGREERNESHFLRKVLTNENHFEIFGHRTMVLNSLILGYRNSTIQVIRAREHVNGEESERVIIVERASKASSVEQANE